MSNEYESLRQDDNGNDHYGYRGQEINGEWRLTDNELYILQRSKILMPESFLAGADDRKILAYADLIVADWNTWPPETYFTINSMPSNWLHLIPFGEQMFSVLFAQMDWTLMDFDYTDQGLSIRLDRVTKLDISYKNMLEMYRKMVENSKHNILIHSASYGLGTPRFQSSVGQFLKIALGSSFSWNSPG